VVDRAVVAVGDLWRIAVHRRQGVVAVFVARRVWGDECVGERVGIPDLRG
jgi:hypothetical protein